MPFSGGTHTINTYTRHHTVKISVLNCSPKAGLLLLHVATVLVITEQHFFLCQESNFIPTKNK